MLEEQSETIGRDAQLAMLLRHKWQDEIERVVDKAKMGVVPARKRAKTDKWFRRQWFRAMMRDRKSSRQVFSFTHSTRETIMNVIRDHRRLLLKADALLLKANGGFA